MRTVVPTSHRTRRYAGSLGLAVVLLFSMMLGACRSADPVTPGPNEQPIIRTTIAGTVVNEAGLPVAGANVTAHGLSTTTDEYGYFILHNVNAPQDRCVALAKADGFFTDAKATIPKVNGLTEVKMFLQSHGTRKNVDANAGGTLSVTSVSGTASVTFAPSGLVTGSGTAFSGSAHVAIKHLDPADPSFAYYFAGDQAATREDGSRADLISYGVLRVDLRSASGEQLQPAPGKPAQLSYPIPASEIANAPATMPLWFFDEAKGMWVEEGVATRQGNTYVGSVTHFTDWNCDKPSSNNADLVVIVKCNGVSIPGVTVRMGQLTGYTGNDGTFKRFVPTGVDLPVVVDAAQNSGRYFSDVQIVPALSSRELRTVTVELTSPCPTMITGTITDNEDRPVAGRVIWVTDEGGTTHSTALEGVFGMVVPANSQLELVASTWVCLGSTTFTVQTGAGGGTQDVGRIKVCGVEEPVTGDIDVSAFDSTVHVSLSPDGSQVVISGDAPVAVVRSTTDGLLTSSANLGGTSWHYAQPATFCADGSRYSIYDQAVNPSLLIFETATGTRVNALDLQNGKLMPDGQSALGFRLGTGQTWELTRVNVATGAVEMVYTIPANSYGTLLGISSDGSRAALSISNHLMVIDLAGNTILFDHEIPQKEMFFSQSASISADAKLVVGSYYSGGAIKIIVVNTETAEFVRELPGVANRWNYSPSISADGSAIIVQEYNGTSYLAPKLVSVSTGEVLTELSLEGEPGWFMNFSFSRSGNKLAGVYKLGVKTMVRIWNL
ncbi:MAG TPA: carboxypeptidase regulatory-like domain-containing protein [Candidatus Kapabacteria bacterium]|nr:carboxypeptidase regulatory-like domain-containing protein [Candidatus Kapabacteria bacterium]